MAVVLLLFLPCIHIIAGEPLFVPHGADKAGMAFSSVAIPDHWGSFHNQALLTGCHYLSAAVSLESRFSLIEMSSKAISFVIPGDHAPLGMVISHFGNAQYSSLFAGLGSAVTITDRLSIGVQADFYHQAGIGEYQNRNTITFETGVAIQLSQHITAGMHIINPVAMLNDLPSSVTAGVAWQSADGLFLSIDASKATGEPVSLHTGLSWQINKGFVLRAGYLSSPSSFAFGTGFLFNRIQADLGFLVNNRTGVTSSVSFIMKIGRNEE